MLRRIGGLRHHAQQACRGANSGSKSVLLQQLNETVPGCKSHTCTCSTQQVCYIHGSAAAFANPDNKPTPPGRDRNDPTNVKHDTPERDPDDSSDYAPGYYEGRGKGGHRRVASQKESDQVPDKNIKGGPKEARKFPDDDPNLPKPEDPHAPDIPDMDNPEGLPNRPESAEDNFDPNCDPPVGRKTEVSAGSMPEQQSGLAGMPSGNAPPEQTTASAPDDKQAQATDNTSPFGDPIAQVGSTQPGKDLVDEGRVKEGAPSKPGPEETHKYP